MGQRLNPISLRLNNNRLADSKWFSRKNYGELISEDFYFRFYIENFLRNLLIPLHRIVIKRNYDQVDLFVYLLENKHLRRKNFNFRKYYAKNSNKELDSQIKHSIRFGSKIKRQDAFLNYMFYRWYNFGPRDSSLMSRQIENFDKPFVHEQFLEKSSSEKGFSKNPSKRFFKKKLFRNFRKSKQSLQFLQKLLLNFFKKNFLIKNLNFHFVNLEKNSTSLNSYVLVHKPKPKNNIKNSLLFAKNYFKLYTLKSSFHRDSIYLDKNIFSLNYFNRVKDGELNLVPFTNLDNTDFGNAFISLNDKKDGNILEQEGVHLYENSLNNFYKRKVLFSGNNDTNIIRFDEEYFREIFKTLYLLRLVKNISSNKWKNLFQTVIKRNSLESLSNLFGLIKKNRLVFEYKSIMDDSPREKNLDLGFISINRPLTKNSTNYAMNVRDFFRVPNYLKMFTHVLQISLLYQSASLLGSSFSYIIEKNFNEEKGRRHRNILRFLKSNFYRCMQNYQKMSISNHYMNSFTELNGGLNNTGSKFKVNNSHFNNKLGLLFILKGKFRRDGKKQIKKYKFNLPMRMQKKTSLVDYFHTFIFTRFGILSFKIWLYTPSVHVNSGYKKLYQLYNFKKYNLNERLHLLAK